MKFFLDSNVTRFIEGRKAKVGSIAVRHLGSQVEVIVPCDMVIIGAGVTPATSFLPPNIATTLGAINVDTHLNVIGFPDIWAAGDICRYPHWSRRDQAIRIEHYNTAAQQGRVVARNIIAAIQSSSSSSSLSDMSTKAMEQYTTVPFFWTSQYGLSIRYVGHQVALRSDDKVEWITKGNVTALKFVTYIARNDVVEVVITCNADPVAVAVKEMMESASMPPPSSLLGGGMMFCASLMDQRRGKL